MYVYTIVPLVFLGAYIGYKKETIEQPVATSKIPRQVPEQPWFMSTAFSVLIGGTLRCVVLCRVELCCVMSKHIFSSDYNVYWHQSEKGLDPH